MAGERRSLPTYHFTSPTGEDCHPFDPNGAIFHRGRYHLGYIYQAGGRHSWGHVSSADLLRWCQHPPLLAPGPEGGIFSGNAFHDRRGRVVLAYHGLGDAATGYPAGNCLAVARDDDLDAFAKLAANPVMRDPGWDPHVWLDGDTCYAISGSNPREDRPAMLYASDDEALAHWELCGPLLTHEPPGVFPDEDLSCPDLFRLGDRDFLLCISHSRGARYYVGHFADRRFHPEAHGRMNWPGGTCFAPETLLDGRGRRIMWAWVLGSPSTMTLPRVLTLDPAGELGIAPVEELARLRRNPQALTAIVVPADTTVVAPGIAGACKELEVVIEPQDAASCGVTVFRSPDGAEETVVAYEPARGVLQIELERSSLDPVARPRTYTMTFMLPEGAENPEVVAQEAPFALRPGELLHLRLFLDRSILEVFANGRQCLTQRLWSTRADSMGIGCFARGGAALVRSLTAWDMAPIALEPATSEAGV